MRTVTIELSIAEVAAIAQRSLLEKITGEPWGTFSGIWEKLEAKLKEAEKPKLKVNRD